MSKEILMNVINSNDLTTLAALCSKIISSVPSPNSNPFAFEKVIVMNKGMQTYLQQEIAEQNGVCSGIDFVQVWAFIWSLHKTLNNADSSNRFSHEHMTWSIFSLMEDIAKSDDAIYKPMKEYLKIESSIDKTEKAYQLCGAIADTFDQYQMYRPDWILDWNHLTDDDFKAVSVKDGKYTVAEGSKLEKWIKKVAQDYRLKGINKNSINSILGNIWQIKLWTKLKGNLEKTCDNNEANLWDRATVVKELILKLTDLKAHPEKIDYNTLPKRVFIFGVTALPTQVIELFRALGQVVPVFFMNLNPCKEYWGDLRSEFSEWKSEKKAIIKYLKSNALKEKYGMSPLAGTSDFKFNESEDDYCNRFEKLFDENKEIVEGNPLLISLGKQGRDTLNVLLSQDAQVDITPAFIDPTEDSKSDNELSILDSLKYRLLTLSTNTEQKHKIAANDRSLQIRSCHTPLREIEILRDEILSTIKNEKDVCGKSTAPRDMLVMMPDIESYAPLIEAVFGSVNRDDPDFIPYSICDQTVRSSSKIADAIVQLLSIGNKGITANLVTDLLSVDAIAKKFDITVEDLSVIEGWLDKVNVHWGLDEEDIKEHLKLDDKGEPLPWTLDAGLERLLNGFMLGKDGSTIAYDNFEPSDFELLNKFCNFVDKIKLVRDVFSPNLNITTLEWTDKLQSLLLNNFFVLDEESKEEVEAIRQILSEMNEAVNNLKGSESSQDNTENADSPFEEGVRSNIKIKLPVFRAKLIHAFGNDRDSSRYLRGGLIFCSLMPMRAVPFKHIYILGLNDDAFPRKDTTPSFNLMGVKSLSRINDRSLSIDDRYIFLEAILSAEKSLYLSYLGESPIDKTQKNPSTVITELEDYLGDNFTVQDTDNADQNRKEVIARVFRQEYLNSYDLRNFEKEDCSLKLYPSFNEKAFWKQEKDQKSKYVPIGFLQDHNEDNPWNISLPYNITVSISDLKQALLKPCLNILKKGLRIRLDLKYQTDLKDEEPFDLGSYGGNDILAELLSEEIMLDDVDAYLDQKAKKGELPYGIFLNKVKTQVKESLKTLLAIKAELANDNNSEKSYLKTVEVTVAGQKHQVTFGGVLPKNSNLVLGSVSSDNKTTPNIIIESYLRLLAYKFTTRQQLQPIKVVKVNSKGQSSYVVDPEEFTTLCEEKSAEELLKELVNIYIETNLIPVPIVRASYKNIVIAEDTSSYLKLAVGQDSYEDDFIKDKEATYLFGQDTSMQFDGDYLSEHQKDLANRILEIYATEIAPVAAEPKKSKK